MLQRTIAKNKTWRSVSVDIDGIDQGDYSDGEDFDEEMVDQVESH